MEPFAWPAAITILGALFIAVFRGPIGRVLERTKKVGASGLETFESPQLPAPAERPDPLNEFMAAYDNQLLREHEASIMSDIAARGLSDSTAIQKVLIRSLAGTQILLLFERAQSLIWASQVGLLTYLNSRGGDVPLEEVRPFFEDAFTRFPDLYRQYSFDAWVGFLQSWLLLERRGEQVTITRAGREFLKWRIEAGRAGPFHG